MPRDRWPMAVASVLGVGRAPIAPGTFGSLAALPLVLAAHRLWGGAGVLAAGVLTGLVGLWAAGRAETILGRQDPGPVVIDELSGQLLSLAFLPLTVTTVIIGFLAFRLFDIVKPFPARRAERLGGGLGIMLDDWIAAAYAQLALRLWLEVS